MRVPLNHPRGQRTQRAVAWLCAVLPTLPLTAWAQSSSPAASAPPAGRDRIVVGAAVRDCNNDAAAHSAIASRLRQLGLAVEAPGIGTEQCRDLECASQLSGESGFLLGTQFAKDRSTTYVVDLLRDRILVQHHVAKEADKPERLARQAAALVDRIEDPFAPWIPRSQVKSCAEPGAGAAAAEAVDPILGALPRGDSRIVLSLHAPASVARFASEFQRGVRRALGEMGFQVTEVRGVAPPNNPRDVLPQTLRELPLLDVQLLVPAQADKRQTPDGAIVRLTDPQGGIQTELDCAASECEPAQLARLVRRNAAALMDTVGPTSETTLPMGSREGLCLPVLSCPKFAQLAVPSASPQPAVLAASPAPLCQPQGDKRRIIGGVLLGVGLAGAGAFGLTYALLDGQRERLPSTDTVLLRSERTDARPALAGVALGGATAVVGGVLIGLHYRDRNKQKEAPCAP